MSTSFTIGITGGIGAGKSVVSRILRCNGYKVYDCDREAKFIMNQDVDVKVNLIQELGPEIYFPDGDLNRSLMSELLFTKPHIRKKVNHIVHAAVRKDIENKRNLTKGLFFIESAILSTGGLIKYCNEIWIIESPDSLRYKRIEKRDNLNKKEIEKRIESQKRELDSLKDENAILLFNDNFHPLLLKILGLTKKIINHQTYILSC